MMSREREREREIFKIFWIFNIQVLYTVREDQEKREGNKWNKD